MAWIELHQSVIKHKKTLNLAKILKKNRRETIGILCDLWLWAIDNADKNGVLEGITSEGLGMVLELTKKQCEKTVNALVEAGFLRNDNGTYIIHDWYDYCGKLNDKRESDRKRKANARANSAGHPTDIPRTSVGHPIVTVPNLTVPNLTVPNKSIYRADKPPTHTRVFKPPSIDEVQTYCRERKNNVDAEKFIDFYTSKNWMIGKNKMKDWKASVRTWEKSNGGRGSNAGTAGGDDKPASQFAHLGDPI